jgi:hypothetical protein
MKTYNPNESHTISQYHASQLGSQVLNTYNHFALNLTKSFEIKFMVVFLQSKHAFRSNFKKPYSLECIVDLTSIDIMLL